MAHDRVPQHKKRLATDRKDMENADQELKKKVSDDKAKSKERKKDILGSRQKDEKSEES